MGWFFVQFNFIPISRKIYPFNYFLIFIAETIVSLGWAHLIFKVFIEGQGSLKDVLFGIKKYVLKATGVAIVSGFVIALAVFNIRVCFYFNSSHRFIDYLLAGAIFWILIFWLLASMYQWPILFFQNPPFLKIFYKSFLLVFGNWVTSILILFICFSFILLFCIIWPFWFFFGAVFLFSIQCVVLEKYLLRYKITYENKPLELLLDILKCEQQRGWHELFKPWENK